MNPNIWPAAIRGTGFYEVAQTDQILPFCHRSISLIQAQRALEKDWYAAWLRYVVATGHIQQFRFPLTSRGDSYPAG
jgi:hypothetical protein